MDLYHLQIVSPLLEHSAIRFIELDQNRLLNRPIGNFGISLVWQERAKIETQMTKRQHSGLNFSRGV